jgi:hypothetical protein
MNDKITLISLTALATSTILTSEKVVLGFQKPALVETVGKTKIQHVAFMPPKEGKPNNSKGGASNS